MIKICQKMKLVYSNLKKYRNLIFAIMTMRTNVFNVALFLFRVRGTKISTNHATKRVYGTSP